ncbi:unnamed protein product [Heligmosomoides polygyrus]|uniref:VWFA domain-containing protein n=1 Tax=Heligmosomoides polygyrus TaxID=6339 RepID=A0A3P7XNW1_HELPZ|nr:unnamed protein product [Heligmosomoides polygyrus]
MRLNMEYSNGDGVGDGSNFEVDFAHINMVLTWLSSAVICTAAVVFGFPMTTATGAVIEKSGGCSDASADVVFVIDTTSSNATAFLVQQHRLLRTLKRFSNVLKGRSVRYGVISFHRTPELMLELESPFANDTQRVSDLISSLRPRQSTTSSVAKALHEAMSLFFESRSPRSNRRQIIILAHDGVNTDLVAETVEAVSNVEKLGAVVFAVTGSSRPNAFALLGYAGSRDRIFISPIDRPNYQQSLDEALGICESLPSASLPNSKSLRRRVYGVRARHAKEEKNPFVPGTKCGFEKVDLTLVLDTSGSVFRVFEDQRQIALEILSEIPDEAYSDAVQVSVTRFAANADVILPFLRGRAVSEVQEAIKEVFVLISDGHGQEYWNVVQATGKRLQETRAELFAVSASQDYNEAELLIYVGDESRVFVGSKYNGFLPALSSYVKDCIFKGQRPPLVISATNSLESATTEEPLPADEPSESVLSTTEDSPLAEEDLASTPAAESEFDDGSSASTPEPFDDGDNADTDGQFVDDVSEVDGAEISSESRAARLRDIGQGSSSCEVDVVLIVDRSESVEGDFKKEIEDATVELPFKQTQRELVVKALQEIRHTGGSTSSVTGARLAIQQLVSTRRPKARLVTLLFSDGQSQDYWRELIETSMRLRDTPNSILLAITASQSFSQSELQVWAGESSRVFVSSEETNFLHAVTKEVKSCGKEELQGKLEEQEGIMKNQGGAGNVTQAKLDEVESTTADASEDEFSTPLAEESVDDNQLLETTVVSEILPIEPSSTASTPEASGVESTVPQLQTTAQEDVTSTSTESSPSPPSEATTAEDSAAEASTSVTEPETVAEGSGDEGSGADVSAVEDRRVHGIRTAHDVLKIAERKTHGPAESFSSASSSCLTDLMFVIDTSTSVEAEFQQQLQLAVDLVKRLPSEDFEHRIRVGVVVFNAKSSVALPMAEVRSRSAVLDSLLSLRHSGGSTSVASGVNIAMDEIERDHRSSARLMVVLLSDGNSQDHWDSVIRASNRLRTTGADVYAVTISKRYMFRELELYAGDKLRVYIDARVRQFLDETEEAVTHCGRPAKNPSSTIALQAPKSCSLVVDLVIVLDTSTSVEEFYREKQLSIDLLKALPASVFERQLAVSIIAFANTSTIVTPLGLLPKDEIVFELERIGNSSGPASLTAAAVSAISEIKAHRRGGSRVVVIFVSNGNGGEDKWRNVKKSSATLQSSGAEVFAVSLTETANIEKLKAYTGSDKNLYLAEQSDKFIEEVGRSILLCGVTAGGVNNIESDDAIPQPDSREKLVNFKPRSSRKSCPYDKMDLQIILDASSSRREVFEHQRELALSLIERLPISSSDGHVAVGIASFTSVPTIRLPLGSSRDKATVRAAVEAIDYHGGSTLTAQAVDLSIDDLLRGKRPDAIQVVVLMNDGFSQDTWDRVLAASERLASTKAERFGVALGNEVDLRELNHYIDRADRIYRDGSTEKFLNDVVSLLKGEKDCPGTEIQRESITPRREQVADECSSPNLDLVVIFDNSDRSPRKRSLKTGARVRVSVISFGNEPKVTLDFTDISDRDKIFAQTAGVTCFAVDSSPRTNVTALAMFTGSTSRVYPYERNAEFSKEINRMANAAKNPKCNFLVGETRERVHAAAAVEVHPNEEGVYSTPGPLKLDIALQRDILGEPLNVDKINEGKVLLFTAFFLQVSASEEDFLADHHHHNPEAVDDHHHHDHNNNNNNNNDEATLDHKANPSSNHRTNHKNHYPSDNNHHCLHVSFLEHGAYAAGSSLN